MEHRKLTFKEVNEYSRNLKKPLQDWCRLYEVDYNDFDTKEDLKRKLIVALDLQEVVGMDFNDGPSVIDNEVNDPPLLFKGQRGIEFPENIQILHEQSSVSNLYPFNSFLQVTIDELIQYWQKGFVCHPRIISHAKEQLSSDHNATQLIYLDEIFLNRNYDTNYDLLLELDFPSDDRLVKLCMSDLIPIFSLKKIWVHSIEKLEMVKRILINTNVGVDLKEFPIEVISEISEAREPVDFQKSGVEVSTEIKNDLKLLNSFLGAVSIASYFEKKALMKGIHPLSKINANGTFYALLFGKSNSVSMDDYRLLPYFLERLNSLLKQNVNEGNQYFLNLMKLLQNRNTPEIIDLVLSHHRGSNSKISPFHLNELKAKLDENLLNLAIEAVPGTPRDPILIFCCLLNQYSNSGLAASNDRQSLMFALVEIFEEEIIRFEEALIVSFLFGYFIGYELCWNPVFKKEEFDWDLANYVPKLVSRKNTFYESLNAISKYTSFSIIPSKWDKNEKLLKSDYQLTSRTIENRKLVINDFFMELMDHDVALFKKYESKSNILFLMYLVLNHRDNLKLPDLISTSLKYENDPLEIFNVILSRLKKGEYTIEERKTLREMINLS